jgi:hypothetical protein
MESSGHEVAPTRPANLRDVINALDRAGVVLTDAGVELKKPRRP